MQDARLSGSRPADRRRTARRRTLLGGRISVDKLETFDAGCTVRNVSEGGARLSLTQPVLVPSTFRLGISGEAGRAGRLVWYRGGEIGVAFGDAEAADIEIAESAEPPASPPSETQPAPPLQIRMQAIMARRPAPGTGFTRP